MDNELPTETEPHGATSVEEDALTPERRLDAIADIFARALARLVLAEASLPRDVPEPTAQVLGMSPESTLIDGRRRAHMGPAPAGGAPRKDDRDDQGE